MLAELWNCLWTWTQQQLQNAWGQICVWLFSFYMMQPWDTGNVSGPLSPIENYGIYKN